MGCPYPEEWLSRAERELDRFNWNPLGDGFWLRLTDRGEARIVNIYG